MIDLEATLKESLKVANDRFKQADVELHEVVAEASSSLFKATNHQLSLELVKNGADVESVKYGLFLFQKANSLDEITRFRVLMKGYPIERIAFGGDTALSRFKNRVEIQRYFEDLFKNPDSSLVLRATYFLNKGKS